jgi:hypothetical protein
MMALRMRVGAVGDGREALVDVKIREAAGYLGGTVQLVGMGVGHGARGLGDAGARLGDKAEGVEAPKRRSDGVMGINQRRRHQCTRRV